MPNSSTDIDVMTSDSGVYIGTTKDGKVSMKTVSKYAATTSCNMDFDMFPFDVQKCYFKMVSLLPIEEVQFVGDVVFDSQEHVVKEMDFQAEPYLENMTLTYDGITVTHNIVGYTSTLRRNSSPYFYSYFVPVCGMVIVASMSFVIPPEIVPGRIALLVTLLLTMVSVFATVQVNF